MGKSHRSKLQAALDAGARNQYAALCYRVDKNRTQVLLITSRGTRRWILPKGWPMTDKSPAEAAAQEAWEEAGVAGKLIDRNLGFYTYDKLMESGKIVPCIAMVYPIAVKNLADDYPEMDERRRKWFSPKKAATLVHEPELARLLLNFDASKLG